MEPIRLNCPESWQKPASPDKEVEIIEQIADKSNLITRAATFPGTGGFNYGGYPGVGHVTTLSVCLYNQL